MLNTTPILTTYAETVGNWQFRDDLTDLSTYSNDLVYQIGNQEYSTGITEEGNTAITFLDAQNTPIAISAGSDFEMDAFIDFTLEIIFKTTSITAIKILAGYNRFAHGIGYNLLLNEQGQLGISLGESNWEFAEMDESGTLYNDGLWHYAAVVINRASGVVILYVNGVFINFWDISNLGSFIEPVSASFYVGSNYTGDIDQVMITKKALGAKEIWERAGNVYAGFSFNNSADETSNTIQTSLNTFDVKLKHICDHQLTSGEYTSGTCPRCLGTNYYYDIKFGTSGQSEILSTEDKLLQALEKLVLTDSNIFHADISTNIISRIGSITGDVENLIKYDLIQAVATLQENQQQAPNLSSRAIIDKLDSVEVIRENATSLRYIIKLITVSGNTLELSGSINTLS